LASSRSSLLGLLLVGAVLGGLAAWWLFSAPVSRSLPREAPQDDLQMLASLTDGATTAPVSDVLVVGPTAAYLARASDRTVIELPSAGGKPRTLVHLDAPAWAMTLAGGTLWLTARDQILQVPIDGKGAAVLPCDVGRPRGIAADARGVYVVDVDAKLTGLTRTSAILRIPVAGGETRVMGRSGGEITNVAIDGENVYWADRLEGTILVAAKEGGDPRALATDRGLPGSLAVAGDALVWVEKRSESLWTMPKAGGAPRRLAQDFAGFANVVAGARSVFWTNEAAVEEGFRVLSVPLAGGDVTPVGPSVVAIDAIATDGTRVLWDRGGAVTVVEADDGG
jgi:hypothetical protein